ncbi:MAG: polyprenyl synthetase family protein [Chloroflexota bacterium]|nr:polyprenyl synthetase family protein [Chloroflexota bacterium]
MKLETSDLFATMQPELLRVESRVRDAAKIDFPFVSSLILDLVQAGGKRLRPLVLLLAARAYRFDVETLVTAAAGVELLHTASLVHDDTVDRSALRRGKPTLNSVLNSGAVILIGDYLFAQSAMLAAATKSPRVVAVFASTLADICDGQLREIFDAHRLDQSRAEYDRRIYGKTAALFAGAAEMGAIIGEAPESHIEAVRGYGTDVGLAFQIVDDVLDLREGTDGLGKPGGQDLRQGTVTLPIMLYAEKLPEGSEESRLLRAVLSGEQSEPAAIDAVIRAVRASGTLDETLAHAARLTDRAKDRLSIIPDPETKAMLDQVADIIWERTT